MTGGNFWQGAATGLTVSLLNHVAHSDNDNGYDRDGNKINDKGGDKTDYLYENGKIVASTSVETWNMEVPPNLGERFYGGKWQQISGGIQEDNTFFELYAGGKIVGAGLSYLGEGFNLVKVPVFKALIRWSYQNVCP